MKLGLVFAASLAPSLLACGDLVLPADPDGGDSVDSDSGLSSTMGDASHDVPDVPEPPAMRLVSFVVSAPQITEGGAVTFRAIVSDAKVTLADIETDLVDETGARYGALATNGTFALTRTLSWSDIDKVRPIATADGLSTRTFTAMFRARGELAAAAVALTLACPMDKPKACGGTCAASCP
jgi:hypothetical protein